MKYNMIHLYIGNGKGKTSASYGLVLRAIGNNLRVLVISFLKNNDSGELKILNKMNKEFGYPHVSVSSKSHSFFFTLCEEEKNEVKCEVGNLFSDFKKAVSADTYDLIILDEIIDAVNLGLVDEDELITVLSKRNSEVVLTGRNPSDKLLSISDYVSNIEKIKHPFDCGISARQGIEY